MNNEHKGVKVITGNPKHAIRQQSLPLFLSFFLMIAFNIVDSIWVAGLGTNPLAALGFISPIFMINVGLGNGVGAGVTSLIARCIGAKNKEKAENAACHGLLISLIMSILFPIILLIILKPLLIMMGASNVLNYAYSYGSICFIGSFTIYFTAVGSSILRGEGDVNRAMIIMALTAILNIILDPIFIYVFGWGISGAAYATVLSSFISTIVILYWILMKQDTYLKVAKNSFHYTFTIIKDILTVGLPSMLEQIIIQANGIILNAFLAITAGTTAVAVFTAAWRIISIGFVPDMAIATAALTVGAVAYGGKNFENLKTSYYYAIKLAILFTIIIILSILYFFAPQISLIFVYSNNTSNLLPLIAKALRVLCFFLLLIPIGIMSGFMYQAIGKGTMSLLLTFIRELLFILIVSYILSIILGFGEIGVWYGMVIGAGIGNILSYIIFTHDLRKIEKNINKSKN